MLAPFRDSAVQIGKPQGAEEGNDEALAQRGKVEGEPGSDATEYGGFDEFNRAHTSDVLFVSILI